MERAVQVFLLIQAALFFFIAFQGLVQPAEFLMPIGFQVQSVNSLNEARAAYGGLQGALGLLLLLGALFPAWRKTGLRASVFVYAGFAFGRVLSLVLDGRPDSLLLWLLTIELVSGLLALFLLLCWKGPQANET